MKDILTARQYEVILAIEKAFGNKSAAARELGLSRETVRDSFYQAQKRLSEARENGLGAAAPPPGWEPVKISTDAEGKVKAVKSIPTTLPVETVPESHLIKGVSTLFDGSGTVRAQWIKTRQEESEREQKALAALDAHMEQYRGVANPSAIPETTNSDWMVIHAWGDPHIGMLSWGKETGHDFNLEICRKDLQVAVDLLIDQTPAADTAMLCDVGDLTHVENAANRTPTGGNALDADSRIVKIFQVSCDLLRYSVDRMLTKHKNVVVAIVPGNHEPLMSRLHAQWLQAVYEREPRVSIIDNRPALMYYRFGTNLLGFNHGDGIKLDQLPGIMATERKQDWAETNFRMWLTGHIHHKKVMKQQEYPGCIVESFRTLAPPDYWHSWKGYRSQQGIEALMLHKTKGLKGRVYVSLDEIRDEQET